MRIEEPDYPFILLLLLEYNRTCLLRLKKYIQAENSTKNVCNSFSMPFLEPKTIQRERFDRISLTPSAQPADIIPYFPFKYIYISTAASVHFLNFDIPTV